MAAKRLKKGESALDRVGKIERQLAAWRTKQMRANTAISKLEKQRAYYTRKAIEQGVS